MVILTSFKKALKIANQLDISPDNIYSVARFQPKGYAFKQLSFLSATDKNGNKLLLRNFDNPIEDYANALKEGYKARWQQIKQWLDSLETDEDIILVCWCPYSSQTQNQIKEYGSFCCHTGLIGKMINKHRPEITVVMDEDRDKMLVEEWKPDKYIPLEHYLKNKREKEIEQLSSLPLFRL